MKIFSALIFLFLPLCLIAQSEEHDHHLKCGWEDHTEAFFDSNPGQRAIAEAAEAELEEFTRAYAQRKDLTDEVLTIPVVFHIVHFNGVENISDAQVHSAIDVLNEDFNAANSDIGQVNPAFQDIVGDVEVEFKLAKLDPDGNCTNGIVRVVSTETFGGGEDIKSAAPTWGRSDYLNIWVCAAIGGGVAGYAYLPAGVSGSSGAAVDGILILHDYVGRIGTSNATRSHALTHEVGHWANLRHTWGNGDPGEAGNCSSDDGVSDTPNTIGWQSCDLNGTTCGSLDNVENFMDYSYCYRMFTEGQKNRMRAALNSSIAGRNQLHTAANLAQTGVLGPDVVCLANFQTDREPVICAGQSIEFQDISFNGITDWLWSFEGGDADNLTISNPEVTYNEPGVYDVSLTVSNESGSESVTKQSFITVLPNGEYDLPFSESFEDFTPNNLEENHWFVQNPTGSVAWELREGVGYTGNKSIYVHGRINSQNHTETISSPTYDLSFLDVEGESNNAVLTFKYAHAQRLSSSDDELRVYISRNCGENWSLRRTIDIDDLPTVDGFVSGEFVPDGPEDWREVEIENIVSVFLNDAFRIRFEYTSVNGNNIYIDDINIVDGTIVSTEDYSPIGELNLFPNPSADNAALAFTLNTSSLTTVAVLDLTGREILQVFEGNLPAGEQFLEINLQGLQSGVYFIRVNAAGRSSIQKLVKQ